jgi:hypothetical protein
MLSHLAHAAVELNRGFEIAFDAPLTPGGKVSSMANKVVPFRRAKQIAAITLRTLIRWTKVPEFQAANRQARRAAYSQAVGLSPACEPRSHRGARYPG